jgi:integrase
MTKNIEGTRKRRPRPRAKREGSIFMPKGSRFYWIAYWSGGKRYYESTKSTRKEDAVDLLRQKLGDISQGIEASPKIGTITVAAALKAVLDDQKMNNRRDVDQTQRRIERHLVKACSEFPEAEGYFVPDRRMSSIRTGDLEQYRAYRRIEQKAETATVNRELAIVRRAFRLARKGGLLVSVPHIPMAREENIRQGFFEAEAFEAILKHLPSFLHPALKFMYTTGWRKSEVFDLTAPQVDLTAGIVRLEPGTTKSGEGRTIFLTSDLRKLLKVQIDAIEAFQKEEERICPYVFHRDDGTQIKDFRKLWTHATDTAGYPGRLLHDFRRTAVRNLERAGVPRSTAMKMVGHQTESIYRRYAIQDEAMLREAAEKQDAWIMDQRAKAAAVRRGQVKRFKSR